MLTDELSDRTHGAGRDFLPNRRLAANGLSCAGCHPPHGLFVDHQLHDVGSGGAFKTPTSLNANFNGPYFHDGRYAHYAQVVAHFDREFYLGLSAQDRTDLVAYLQADQRGQRTREIRRCSRAARPDND